MKNCILKGMCIFFMLLSLFLTTFTLVSSAQSGSGGSTQVVARIEPETAQPTAASAQPSSTQSAADGLPIRTGEAMAWFAIIALIVSGIFVIVLRLKHADPSKR